MSVQTGVTTKSILVRNHLTAPIVTRYSLRISTWECMKVHIGVTAQSILVRNNFSSPNFDMPFSVRECLVTLGAEKWFLTIMDWAVTPVWTLMPFQFVILSEYVSCHNKGSQMVSHQYGFRSDPCMNTPCHCPLNLSFSVNFLSQSGQTNGFSLVWIAQRSDFCVNSYILFICNFL